MAGRFAPRSHYSPTSASLASTQITANYRGLNLYRPNRAPGRPLTQGRSVQQADTGYIQYINFNALQLPATQNAPGQYLTPFGNLGRNPARTPERNEMDVDVNKRFSTPIERLSIEFRSELYNLFNHTNFYLPSGALSGTLTAYTGSGAQLAQHGHAQRRWHYLQHLHTMRRAVRAKGNLLGASGLFSPGHEHWSSPGVRRSSACATTR